MEQPSDQLPSNTLYPPIKAPSLEEVYGRIESWHQQFPGIVHVRELGKSLQGRPLLSVRITEPESDDEHKEVSLMTGLHSGLEQSGTMSMLYTMKWLLSSDPAAKEILNRNIIVFMPVPNPDGYVPNAVKDPFFNAAGKDLYSRWSISGPTDPPNNPEGVAVQQTMEEYRPELHGDWHGLFYSHDNYAFIENAGASYSNLAVRPYHRRMTYLMCEAALKEGYPMDIEEEDSEELYWGPELESISSKLWRGRSRFFAAVYAYYRFHSLTLASEVGWPRSGYLRQRRLLEIGNELWPGEFYPGFPTRVIMRNTMDMIVAYGETARQRRDSRVELWNLRTQLTQASNTPIAPGKALHVTVLNPAAAEHWLPSGIDASPIQGGHAHFNPGVGRNSATLNQLLDRVDGDPRFNARAIREFARDLPPLNGVQVANDLTVMRGTSEEKPSTIQHGLSVRLRLPFGKAKIIEIRVNGHLINESPTNGFLCYRARGFTYVQIDYPPNRTKTEDIFIATCKYDPGEKRTPQFDEIFDN